VGPLGECSDTNGNGRDQVHTEMTQLELRGTSPTLGPLTVRLRDPSKHPFQPTLGEIEEQANNTPGILDVPPFTPTGAADSFFDVFFEVESGGMILHNPVSKHLSLLFLSHKPPRPGETYEDVQAIELWDESGNPTGARVQRVTLTPNPLVDLLVAEVEDPSPVHLGQRLTYELYVFNFGPQPATGVALTDTLPAGVRLVSATSPCATCQYAGGIVTVPVGTMAPNQECIVTIVVAVREQADLLNDARLTADAPDANGWGSWLQSRVTVLPPLLGYRMAGQWFTVFWPRDAEGFQLQATDSLVNPQWQSVPVNPTGEEYTADLDASTGMKFLRLVK